MRFAFTDDQIAFRDAVREFLDKECTPAHVRAAWTNQSGRVPGLWDKLAEMGVVGILAPEANGGLALTMVDLVLILEETGRCALPEPIVETTTFGGTFLGRADVSVGVGHVLVPWADTVDVIINHAGQFDRADVELIPHTPVDGARRVFEVRGTPQPIGGPALTGAFDRAQIGTAAQQCGLAQRMLEMTADYTKERKQFGVPIGSFQAVKHHLANARVALEFARPLVYRAAVTVDPVHACMAKLKADEAALTAAKAALQCHGAIGYTTEYDLHLYMKRAWALSRSTGDAPFLRKRIGENILPKPGS
jgi:alkylation response protein AidB-like acyl-CoA dehydrogenase